MTWKICIRGVVQGVGFRPFVWRAALDKNLTGSVANGLAGVVIRINGSETQAIEFQTYILKNAPAMARITGCSMEPDAETFFDSFTIEESDNEGLPILLLTPDVALCAECRSEIRDPNNRRYRYAFTTCTVCGPRYSILTGVPYDRPFTTMRTFDMCKTCRREYENPDNRRFYAQTNSCQDCGIRMLLFDCRHNRVSTEATTQEQIIQQVITAWQHGAIVAIKGIGGYLLTCDATNPASIAALRSRKHRPTKPFALMYPDLATLHKDALVSPLALELLHNPAAPIVLLALRETDFSGLDRSGIAPGLGTVGAMLPNAPLFDLLLRDFSRPIVATSGNVSNTPLIYKDETAVSELSRIADYILEHNRDIVMPQDDSVMAVSRYNGIARNHAETFPVVLRRARGLAPSFLQQGLRVADDTVLALGAEMKGTFTIAHLGNINVSQYLGDLSDYAVQERFQHTLHHLCAMLGVRPSVIIGDMHPGYFSTQLGRSLAEKWAVPFHQVQHHAAHFAAVLAENNLLNSTKEPILGVIWDGTGFGSDGQIWGGEFFTFSRPDNALLLGGIHRCTHFNYFPLLLGDKMPREPRLSAFSICSNLETANHLLRPKFNETAWNLYHKLVIQPDQLMTSSVGRMFDAVASLLGLADGVSYEGEAALLLEDLAWRHCQQHGLDFETDYINETVLPMDTLQINTQALFQQIIADINDGTESALVAARFHYAMVKIIQSVSIRLNINKIAFSGGVFQNTLLLEMIQYHLNSDCQLFFHRQLSPNDENISFGQWATYQNVTATRF